MPVELLSIMGFLALVERELLLFAGVFFLIGAADEMGVDAVWAWLRRKGRLRTLSVSRNEYRTRPLKGPAAVMVAAWQESAVIGAMISHTCHAWPQRDMKLYIGCYANDPFTVSAAMNAAAGDERVSIILLPHAGPTTKADCLNHIYASLLQDEEEAGEAYWMIVMHDAEDMVDEAALALMDEALDHHDYVQLPVLPLPQPQSRFVGSHYCEEFAEAHGKTMVTRQALGVSVPAAGVGCAFRRAMLNRLVPNGDFGPFSVLSLTEDYELGMRIKDAGGKAAFVRARGDDGRLVATRAWFPAELEAAVRQKGRWVHGIAFQGWDRLGWAGNAAERWMRFRDRRGPVNAVVLLAGYLLLVVSLMLTVLGLIAGEGASVPRTAFDDGLIRFLLAANLICLAWRVAARFAFTAREYGRREALRAVARIPVANIIAIMAARRALLSYAKSLLGGAVAWDKTDHSAHPAAQVLPKAESDPVSEGGLREPVA